MYNNGRVRIEPGICTKGEGIWIFQLTCLELSIRFHTDVQLFCNISIAKIKATKGVCVRGRNSDFQAKGRGTHEQRWLFFDLVGLEIT